MTSVAAIVVALVALLAATPPHAAAAITAASLAASAPTSTRTTYQTAQTLSPSPGRFIIASVWNSHATAEVGTPAYIATAPTNVWYEMTQDRVGTHPVRICWEYLCIKRTALASKPDVKAMIGPVGRSESGMFIGYPTGAPYNGKPVLWYFGGAHDGHSGNDVELFDIANKTWSQDASPEGYVQREDTYPGQICLPNGTTTRESDGSRMGDPTTKVACRAHPGCVTGCTGNPGACSGGRCAVSPQGKPFSPHTRSRADWDPKLQRFVAATDRTAVWAYDPTAPAATRWSQLGRPVPEGRGFSSKFLRYDPNYIYAATEPPGTLFWFLFVPSPAPRGVYAYNYETDIWTRIADIPAEMRGGDYTGAHDSRARRWLVMHHAVSQGVVRGTDWWWFTPPRSGTCLATPSDPAPCWQKLLGFPPEVKGAHSFDYDPVSGHFLVLPYLNSATAGESDDTSIRLWAFDPVNDRWTRLCDGGSGLGPSECRDGSAGKIPVGSGTRRTGTWGVLEYDATHRVFWYLNVLITQGGNGTGGVNSTAAGDGKNATELWMFKYRAAAR
jgi:hypothetical protein